MWTQQELNELPLAVDVVETSLLDGVCTEQVYYQSHCYEGIPIRIFGYCSYPEDGPKGRPALLYIHGGGLTADRELTRLFARRGYVCLSIDWTGPVPGREGYSDFGTLENRTNYFAGDHLEQSFLYHLLKGCACGVSWLVSRTGSDRVGLCGLSWGGYTGYILNGLDNRIRAYAVLFATGNLTDEDKGVGADNMRLLPDVQRRIMTDCLDPHAYLDRQNGPVLSILSTNDRCMLIDRALREFDALTVTKALLIYPNEDHGPQKICDSIVHWFDRYVKGEGSFPIPGACGCEAVEDGMEITLPAMGDGGDWEAKICYFTGEEPHWPTRRFEMLPCRRVSGGDKALIPNSALDHPFLWYYGLYFRCGQPYLSTGIFQECLTPLECEKEPGNTIVVENFQRGFGRWSEGYNYGGVILEPQTDCLRIVIDPSRVVPPYVPIAPFFSRFYGFDFACAYKMGYRTLTLDVEGDIDGLELRFISCEREAGETTSSWKPELSSPGERGRQTIHVDLTRIFSQDFPYTATLLIGSPEIVPREFLVYAISMER